MITKKVIDEIYKKYGKGRKDEDLNLDYFVKLLKPYHHLTVGDMEVTIDNLEEFNPFRCFLIRSINAVLEFDSNVAFVFSGHILFLEKKTSKMHVHIKPEKKGGLLARILGE